ncbi:MAG: dihydrofolate reductase family protein [Nannocystaceae bacterium]|nr:dihydrofolate reductase family protein [Nannocystaceae bacterium]
MRQLAILTFVTLDGVMQAPKLADEDPSGGFTQGGWAAPHWDPVMAQVRAEAMAQPYDVLFGRKTYETFAAAFGDTGGEHPMDRATKYVATSSPGELKWSNSVGLGADIPAAVARLKQQDGPLLQVHGSAQLVQTLLAHELVDEFRLWTFPVLVGPGKRLFENPPPGPMTLVKSVVGPTGVVMGIYRRTLVA